MRRLLMLALLLSLSFATQSSGVGSALQNLCQISQSFLGLLSMLLIIIGPVTAAIGVAIMLFAKGKHKLAELIGKIIVGLGILLTIGAVLSILLYLLTPFLISVLIGDPGLAADPCGLNG